MSAPGEGATVPGGPCAEQAVHRSTWWRSWASPPNLAIEIVEHADGLGLFRSLVGLDEAATEAFGRYLDDSTFTIDQIRFVNLIVDELTVNGIMEPRRLYESPYTDHATRGPDHLFLDADVDMIVEILHDIKARARSSGVA